MKKVLLMLLASVMVLGAKNAFADAVIAAQQQDSRLVDNIDVIWLGYANKIVEHKNIVDFRLNNGAGAANASVAQEHGGLSSGGANLGNGGNEWGGAIDGKHDDLGVIGVYVNRPFAPVIFNAEPGNWTPTGGSAGWTATGSAFTGGGGSFFTAGNGSVLTTLAPARAAGEIAGILTPTNKVDIFWGKTSDNSNLGIHVNFADNTPPIGNVTNTDSQTPAVLLTNTTNGAQVLGADLGLGFKSDSGTFNELDLHGGFSMGGFALTSVQTNVAGGPVNNDSVKDNGIYTVTLGALGQHDLDKDSNLRVFLDGVYNNFGTKASVKTDVNGNGNYNDAAGDADYENTTASNTLGVQLGLGCNHKVNDGAAVFSSGLIVGYASSSSKPTESNSVGAAAAIVTDFGGDEVDTTALNVSWRASVDTKVASWLNVRAGISKNVFNRTTLKVINNRVTAAPTGTTATAQSDGDTSIGGAAFSTGFGIHFENWVLNTTVTATSLESGIASPQVGAGILYPAAGGEGILAVAEADLGYAF